MTSMFWGLRLEPGKRYSTVVDKSFHVSMAALDCSSVSDEVLSVMLEEDDAKVPYILCNLHKHKAMQARLDLNFMTGDKVTFFCSGKGVVHLSGYIVPDDDDFSGPMDDEELEEEEEEDEEEEEEESNEVLDSLKAKGKEKLNGVQTKKRKVLESPAQPSKKKKGLPEAESDDSDDDEDDDADEDMEGLEGVEEESEGMEDDSEDDDDDEDELDEEEESEEEVEAKSTPQQKKEKKNKQQESSPNKQQTPSKSPKPVNGVQNNQQTQKNKKESKKSIDNVAKSKSDEPTSQLKTVEGGVVIRDTKIGNGPVCKNGKMATVYYTGRLKSNNKVFDSTTQGPGFKFRLGRGEVIKGWDVGFAGMKVGGKRFITCPPQMAYGAKGSPPTIPGNSTLVFEVELKNVQ